MDEEIIRITIRMPKAVHADAEALAKEQDRSLNGQLVHLIRIGIAATIKANDNAETKNKNGSDEVK